MYIHEELNLNNREEVSKSISDHTGDPGYMPYIYRDDYASIIKQKVTAHMAALALAPFHRGSGYGKKIATSYIIELYGRKRRIYATCYSNAASHWFMLRGVKVFVR